MFARRELCGELRGSSYIYSLVLTSADFSGTPQVQINPVAKITVLLTNGEFERFQAFCDRKGHKKSTLIARLIREHLDREEAEKDHEISQIERKTPKHK
jgi:hypothetical protein